MKLNVLISTYNVNILSVPDILLPERDGVSYIVSFQYTDSIYLRQIPEELNRPDVKVYPKEEIGLSRNRNDALSHADGDIALIADDDVRYKPEYFDTIIKTFNDNPDVDVALFKMKTIGNEPEAKRYPEESSVYHPQKGYYASSVEMAFRVNSVKGKISFDERFGLGADKLNCGEEEIFLKDCRDTGLTIKYFPYYIVEHHYETTGKKVFAYTENLVSKGAVSSYLHGWSAYLRMLVFSLKGKLRGKEQFWHLIKNTFAGINYERRTRKGKRR